MLKFYIVFFIDSSQGQLYYSGHTDLLKIAKKLYILGVGSLLNLNKPKMDLECFGRSFALKN